MTPAACVTGLSYISRARIFLHEMVQDFKHLLQALHPLQLFISGVVE